MKKNLLLLLLVFGLTSCSSMTMAGRQKHAYQRYARKQNVLRSRVAQHPTTTHWYWPFHHHPKSPAVVPLDSSMAGFAAGGSGGPQSVGGPLTSSE